MAYQDRPQRCLSSYPGPCEHPQVLFLCYSWKDLSVPCTPVWSLDGTPRVYQDPCTCGSTASYPRDKSSCIPQRLDHPSRSLTYSTNHPTSTIFGMDYQLEEVYARTLMHSGLLGTSFQSRTSHSFSSGLILRLSHQCPIPFVNIHGHVCAEHVFHHQSDIAFRSLYPSWMPPTQVLTILDKETSVTTPAVLGHSSSAGCRIPHSTPLVQQMGSSERSTFAPTGAHPIFLHRRISNRMGSQLAESSSIRTMVTPRIIWTHQLAGARGNQIGYSSLGTSVAQSDCSRVLRQQYSSSLHPQAGMDSFHLSVQQDSGTFSYSGPICDSSHSNPSSRSQECDSRCSVSDKQSQPYRMAYSSGNLNTLGPKQYGRHFADDTFNRIFLNEYVRIAITISLKFVPEGPNNNIPALVQIMAWRRPGDKPLSEPMMVRLLTHICVIRPQWVK